MMLVLQTILGLGALIFVHELGHFLAAKAVGIAVPRFSIGLGPITPLRLRRGETEYVISWIPFGGYVKMASREEQAQMAALEGGASEKVWPPHRLFENKSLAARILVISAGVIMNALLAWGIYAVLLSVYGAAEDPTTRVARVESRALPEAAAALAEMPPGAQVVSVDGQAVDSWSDITGAILAPQDPDAETLRFEFAAAAPITIDTQSLDRRQRAAIARALVPMWEARVSEVSAGQPASAAGLSRGDLVTSVDELPVDSWDAMVQALESRGGKKITLTIRRGEEALEVSLVPAKVEITDPLSGEKREIGRIGIGGPLIDPIRVHYGPGEAILAGARQTGSVAWRVAGAFGAMVGGQVSLLELGGPIRIVQISGELARAGLEPFLAFLAFLSINLAILNLLPIPVLDGGHLVFLVLEGLRGGRPLPVALRERLTLAGFYLLLALMVFVIFNDLIRL